MTWGPQTPGQWFLNARVHQDCPSAGSCPILFRRPEVGAGRGSPDCALSMSLPGLNGTRSADSAMGSSSRESSQGDHCILRGPKLAAKVLVVHGCILGTEGLTTLIGFSKDGPCCGIKAVTDDPVLTLPRALAGTCSDAHCQQGQPKQAPWEAYGVDPASPTSLCLLATASHSPSDPRGLRPHLTVSNSRLPDRHTAGPLPVALPPSETLFPH